MRTGHFAGGICLLALTALAACTNPFSTGDPEFPAGSQVDYPQPSSPENVLEILSLALGAQDSPSYIERLTDGFRFEPDPVQAASEQFNGFPAEWTLTQESAFLDGLLSNADSVGVTWSSLFTLPEGSGSRVTVDYEVYVLSRSGTETYYEGRAEMLMEQVSGEWNITEWRDVVVNENPTTWGLLRAQLLGTG